MSKQKYIVQKNLLCWPALLPQITGEERPEVPDATKESVQAPPLVSAVSAGPTVVNVSKSRRTAQTSAEHLLIVYVKLEVSEYTDG